jgi:glutamine synthetase
VAGIREEVEPPAPFAGDVYGAADLQPLPRTLRAATDALETSALALDALGPDVVEHYVHGFRREQEAFDAAVTDWERQRYFERI